MLLHRYLDAGPATRGQGADGDTNGDSNRCRITFGHSYHGHEGAYKNAAADAYAVVSADLHTYVQSSAYRHADAYSYADDRAHGDVYPHPDCHAHTYADGNAYRDTRPNADTYRYPDGNADTYRYPDGNADADRDTY